MTDMDWADDIADHLFWDEEQGRCIHSGIAPALRAAELRGRVKGWREAGNYVADMASEADNEIQGAAFIEAGFELIREADELASKLSPT